MTSPMQESAEELEYRARLTRALGNDYELRDLIGRGGFGVVYRAKDKRLDREVAVKALRHDMFPTPAVLQRFDREAKAVAKLRHPNILPVYTVGSGEGVAFMVMPLVDGESLESCLDRQKTLPADEAARITAEAAGALEAAHKVGLIHRDVKPANIMLEGDERRVLLMDFGIAKAAADEASTITGTGVVMGSPAYMSPEQACGEKDIDGRSDIYALGSVAYEMISGVRPVSARNLHELVFKQVTEKVVDLAERAPSAPAHVSRAVMRCLEKDKEQRWQTAADLRSSLSATHVRPADLDRHGEPDEESWLSKRGPYLLLLVFLLYFIRVFVDLMVMSFVATGDDDWWWLEYGRNGVKVLLFAAVADLVLRVAFRRREGQPWSRVVRYLFGQPVWWQAWYPRRLRVRDSVWDRLPTGMKALRTVIWFQWVLLPFGAVLVVFVIPTFERMVAEAGIPLPWPMRPFKALVIAAMWGLFATLAMLWWQARQARIKHGVKELDFLGGMLNLRGSYWQGSPVRALLKD